MDACIVSGLVKIISDSFEILSLSLKGVSPSYVLTIIGRLDAVGKFFKTLENVLFGPALKPLWGK